MPGETEETAPPETSEPAADEDLPTVSEAEVWLSRTRPAAVLALLKDPKFGAVISRAFMGFRPDAKGFTNPLVRSRLAQAAAKDSKIAEKLRHLSETEAKPGPVAAAPERSEAPLAFLPSAPPAKSDPLKSDPLVTLRMERDTRRRERDTARQELALALSDCESALKARSQAEEERDDALRLAKKQAERISRLERQVTQARQTETRLVKALNEDKISPPLTPRQRHGGSEPSETKTVRSPWPAAIQHLLDKGKFESVLAITGDVLKTDSDDLDALKMAVQAWEGRKEPRSALIPARGLLTRQIQLGDIVSASETLLILFRLLPVPEQAEPDVRPFLAALPAADSAAVSAVRLMLGRLRGVNPNAHHWLTDYISTRTALGPIVMPPPGALGADDPLPLTWNIGRPITARHLTEAVDRNQTTLIEAARTTLLALESTDPETFGRVWAALELAATDDPARLLTLRRAGRGAIIVDGSNVAWFDQESLVHGRPRLRHLKAMRRSLWARGFFPVILYADANLPYSIDDRPALLRMRDRQELMLVDAGTVADEVLLRVAKQMNAPLITNDKMEDWDPEGAVRKVRYAISMSGEAHLLSEL